MTDKLQQLISDWLDGRISEADSKILQDQLRESAKARELFREMADLDVALRSIAVGDVENPLIPSSVVEQAANPSSAFGANIWNQILLFTISLGMVGLAGYFVGKVTYEKDSSIVEVVDRQSKEEIEKTISGYATLRRVAGIEWPSGSSFREGDLLPAGVFAFEQGVAEIDFFCGATLVVEGPAKLNLESDWMVRVLTGRLRANVPPAARGFVVKAGDSEIVDLGTEFAIEVGENNVRVKVIDGEVKLRGGEHDGKHLFTGQGQSLIGDGEAGDGEAEKSFDDLSTIGDVQRRSDLELARRFEEWKEYSQELKDDQRLLAYYPIARTNPVRFIPNHAATGNDVDGKIVGQVQSFSGRFGMDSSSLNFDRPGSRVRARIDGEFEAFTFACWVKIDRLDHLYNALFMSDGYENGEPHWQIHKDGRIMLSVMVDETPGSGMGPAPWARLHHIYYTEPVWNESLSDKWIHLAAVYDPASRRVNHYLNGEQISDETIEDKYHVTKLRIGPAEIGNWGQPFRSSPEFAVRNLSGCMDEMAVFGSALNSEDIKAMYLGGTPFSH